MLFTCLPIHQQRLWMILCLCHIFPVFATPSFQQAQSEYEQGHFEKAIRHWQALLDISNLESAQNVEILIQIANTYQALGLSQEALTLLSQAEQLAQGDNLILAKLFTLLSDISLATRQDRQARYYANKSLTFLPANAPPLIRATVLNNLGNVLTVEAYYAKAVKTYARCVDLADDAILRGRALTNMAQAYLKSGHWRSAVNALSVARQEFESISNNHYAKVFGLINVGELAQRIAQNKIQNKTLRLMAYQALNTALTLAKQLDNNLLISYCYGYLGQLYETAQRYEDALYLTRQAIFYAKLDPRSFFTQQVQTSEILHRWQWQLGRVFKAQHQDDKAINAYRSAVNSLQPIRREMAIGYRTTSQSFRDRLGPIYFELADLLLQRATRQGQKKQDLIEALETIERFKTAELQDYFQYECLKNSQLKGTLLDLGYAPNLGVIYPILLPDRTEILLSLANEIQRFTVPITAKQLKNEANEFRFELETRNTTEFLPYAKRLYHWLIAPLSNSLTAQGVDTLIIVPDGVLRTIPFAALHDGKQFLISKYAIVTTPGLTLTESKSSSRRYHAKILLSGLSESVQDYSALSSVHDEIESISNLYKRHNVTQLLDQNFTLDNFTTALKKNLYSILHIASHSQFDSELQKTFLLTYDGKLSVTALEALIRLSRHRQEPLDLLTLSACQTAVGDDQAALGLAGLAIKAGVKSTLASLWFIDDKATTLLMKTFYQHLEKKKLSKAKALQAAQQYLIEHTRYQHPAYWAAFLLIGYWK